MIKDGDNTGDGGDDSGGGSVRKQSGKQAGGKLMK